MRIRNSFGDATRFVKKHNEHFWKIYNFEIKPLGISDEDLSAINVIGKQAKKEAGIFLKDILKFLAGKCKPLKVKAGEPTRTIKREDYWQGSFDIKNQKKKLLVTIWVVLTDDYKLLLGVWAPTSEKRKSLKKIWKNEGAKFAKELAKKDCKDEMIFFPPIEIDIFDDFRNLVKKVNDWFEKTMKNKNWLDSVTPGQRQKKIRKAGDRGNIVEEVKITTNDGKSHRIIRRDSRQIQVFDSKTDEKEVARHVMAKYIKENGLKIPHAQLSTRNLGKKLLDQLRKT